MLEISAYHREMKEGSSKLMMVGRRKTGFDEENIIALLDGLQV